jgi:molybdate transport system substrate-binding protein
MFADKRYLITLLGLVLIAAACSSAPAPTTAATPSAAPPAGAPATGEVTVFAAASLTDVFNDMARSFQQANPDAHVTFNFASSGTLVNQLNQGARADVFASADQTNMNNAKNGGSLTGPDQVFARNSLIVIVPAANPAHITGLKDLANGGIKVVTANTSVPIGQYTQTMLQKASADPAYGSDFQSKFQANIVSQQTDDKQIVAQVQLGEADAAVVYATDITPTTQSQLTAVQIPTQFNTDVAYPIATTKGDNPTGGQAFVNYVLSPAGQQVLKTWNFLPPTPPAAAAQPTAAPVASGGAPAGVAALAAAAPAAPAPNLAASSTFAPAVAVKGLVGKPREFTYADLMQLPAETISVSFQAGQGVTNATFTGTSLLNLFDAAGGAVLPNDGNNAKLRVSVMVTGADGYQVLFGWGDLDPDYGAAPILLAYLQDGRPMGDKQGMARLVVPGDKRGGRYVSTVKSIELRDPGPALP